MPLREVPPGGEKQLIYAVTRRVEPSGACLHGGALVVNGDRRSIHHVLTTGLPPGSRIATVTGPGKGARKPPGSIGTSFADCIEACGGLVGEFTADFRRTYDGHCPGNAGGARYAGHQRHSCIAREAEMFPQAPPASEDVCRAAPWGRRHHYCVRRKTQGFRCRRRLHVTDCMECGSCAYLCPDGGTLQYLRFGEGGGHKTDPRRTTETKEKGAEK